MNLAKATFVDGYLDDHGDDDADLSSHDSFTSGVPHATFTRLRRDDPVHWTPETDGSGILVHHSLWRRLGREPRRGDVHLQQRHPP